MKKTYFILFLLALLSSCGSAKSSQRKAETISKTEIKTPLSKTAESIIAYAQQFKGTRYKYGGTTKKGMDCSGLIYTTFGEHGIAMPRTTKELSTKGDWVDIKQIHKGDLVFFATKKNSRKINHVGIVTDIKGNEISFIHSSSSRGIMISKLSERYWYFAYVQARRYL